MQSTSAREQILIKFSKGFTMKIQFESLEQQLFSSIAFLDFGDKNLQLRYINEALDKGVDINGVNEDGQTPLTYSIESGTGSPKAVELLLERGADVNLRDHNGFTAWAIYYTSKENPVLKSNMKKIKTLLEKYNVDKSDEIVFEFQEAINNEDIYEITEGLANEVITKSKMISPLITAIETENLSIVSLFIEKGFSVNEIVDEKSPLMFAEETGNRELVDLLIQHGAEVEYYAYDDSRYTAGFMAKEAGHLELSKFLMSISKNYVPKVAQRYRSLLDNNFDYNTNCGSLEKCITLLDIWHKRYKISIAEVTNAGFKLSFAKLPKKLTKLAQELYDFCPDIIEQGYGCMDDLQESIENGGTVSDDLLELIKDIDFSDDNFGLKILSKDLAKKSEISLWWDQVYSFNIKPSQLDFFSPKPSQEATAL